MSRRNLRKQLEQAAVNAVLTGTEWISESEVAMLACSASEPCGSIDGWIHDGRVFAIDCDGRSFFPIYAFDTLGVPLPAVQDVLSVLACYSPWHLAFWFESISSMLGGARPRELIATDPCAVVAAARSHREGPMHG